MSPLRRHTPRSRDQAIERRRRMTVTAAVGGLTAVGVITGALAASAASSTSSTPAVDGSSVDGGTGVGGVQEDPSDSSNILQPPANAPSLPQGRGGGFQAITGGSGHH